jgi:prepilin-type N-terminal cleavage/methylation domain-containing protein
MQIHTPQPALPHRDRGFSLVELLVVVIIIFITAAVALPNIIGYMRNYKVRGGAQQVASSITTARSKAIMRNVNTGVLFGVLDSNTFGYFIEDVDLPLPGAPPPPPTEVVLDLPTNVFFMPAAAGAANAIRFDRLGRACNPGTANCSPTGGVAAIPCPSADRCDDTPGSYVWNPAVGNPFVRIQDLRSGLYWDVTVAPGGRVRTKAMAERE